MPYNWRTCSCKNYRKRLPSIFAAKVTFLNSFNFFCEKPLLPLGVIYQMNLCAKGESVIFKHQLSETSQNAPLEAVGLSAASEFFSQPSSSNLTPASSSDQVVTDYSGETSGASTGRTRVQPTSRRSTGRRGNWSVGATRKRHPAGRALRAFFSLYGQNMVSTIYSAVASLLFLTQLDGTPHGIDRWFSSSCVDRDRFYVYC